MTERPAGTRVIWYRSPVKREDLSRLNRRSDLMGFLQTGGYLGLLAVTGTAAYLSVGRLRWPLVVLLFLFHGICWNFLINGFHELVHDSVFKTRWLNRFFLGIFSFLGWYNHIGFWASHTEHHKFTLHQPDDLEVTLPMKMTLRGYLQIALVNPLLLKGKIKFHWRISRNQLTGPWEKHLFEEVAPDKRRKLVNWSRFVLLGHLTILVVSLIFHLWLLPVVISLAPFYGEGLHYLCNNSQHIGLQDSVADFRLCCRTIYLNPFLRFLYWHMNYHTEHHMYAAVPCYNLGKLHRLIKDDMPHCPRGLVETWTQINRILQRQKVEPGYQFKATLPGEANPAPAAAETAMP